MRKREQPLDLFTAPIDSIKIDKESRDDIPALLLGLQRLHGDPRLREEIMNLLDEHVAPERDRDNGRPGMSLWNILVLGVVKQGLNCDYDRLQELANEHRTLRRMLQHPREDESRYLYRTLKNNVDLLTPELLGRINHIVVMEGLEMAGKSPGDDLAARVDSFVVETDVHYPTDVNLLRDATSAAVRAAAKLAAKFGLDGWRQEKYWQGQLRNAFNRVSSARLWRKRPKEVKEYLRLSRKLCRRCAATLATLGSHADESATEPVAQWLDDAELLRDQVDRRVLRGEDIPQEEKIFSVYQRHTRWIRKGKSKQPVELGVPLTILQERSGFVLAWLLQWEGGDVDAALPLVTDAKTRHPTLESCSFDRGFHSPGNQLGLKQLLTKVILPTKGRGTVESRETEREEWFEEARRQHPAVESAINALEHRGLDRVLLHGHDGFERAVALSILAGNIHQLGRMLQKQARDGPRLKLAA